MRLPYLRLAAALCLLAGCPADSDPADSGSTSVAATTAAVTSGDSASSGGDTTGGSGGGGCDVLPATPTPVTLTLRNATAAPIYLLPPTCGDPLELSGPDSPDPTPVENADCILPSCERLVAGECLSDCNGDGACQASFIRVDPGTTHTRAWTGTSWTTGSAACGVEGCGPECSLPVGAPAGTYGLAARYSTECPNDDPAQCECPDPDNCWIPVDGAARLPAGTLVSGQFAFPTETAPELTVR